LTQAIAGRSKAVVIAVAVSTAVLFATATPRQSLGGTDQQNPFSVESVGPGMLSVDAHGTDLEMVLRAIGKLSGFTVSLEPMQRAPVDVEIESGSTEDVLHRVLRGRNYALLYGGGGERLTRVVVLSPPAPPKPVHQSFGSTRVLQRR